MRTNSQTPILVVTATIVAIASCGEKGSTTRGAGAAQNLSSEDASSADVIVDSESDLDAPQKSSEVTVPDAALAADASLTRGASVLEHHNSPTRNGLYTDAALTRANAGKIHRDTTFQPTIRGMVRAQPLFVDGNGGRKDMILVATEQNWVHAIDTSGATIWQKQLGTPVPRSALACGNIDPYGVTGTPIIDLASRTMFLASMTTPDGGTTKKQLVFAISIDDGSVRSGWPVNVGATNSGFSSDRQYPRSALALVHGNLFVPYSGILDCGSYHGWVISVNVADPTKVSGWATAAEGGSSWAVGGPASDGSSVYVATGNTNGATAWGGGEAVIRFSAAKGATFANTTADFFAPPDWQALDSGDKDIGSSNPLVLDVPGATPSRVIFQLGKPTTAWLLDPSNLGGIGNGLVNKGGVTQGETATAPASYTTTSGTFVVANASCPGGGTVTALRVSATSPPKLSAGWCADQHGGGAVVVSTTDGTHDSIVWGLGATGDNSVSGDNRLHAFNGETGAVLYGGGGPTDGMVHIGRFQSPMIAKGSIYVGAQNQLYRFH